MAAFERDGGRRVFPLYITKILRPENRYLNFEEKTRRTNGTRGDGFLGSNFDLIYFGRKSEKFDFHSRFVFRTDDARGNFQVG